MSQETETILIKCGKCQAEMRVHKPLFHRTVQVAVAQLTLVPSWSLEERVCKSCGRINAPVLGDAQVVWAAFEPAEKPRVEVADAIAVERLRQGGGIG